MLLGVGLGPGDPELLTYRAVRAIREADEVIVPGKMAYALIAHIREPRMVEFPMGSGIEVAKRLGAELAERCEEEDVAFCCIGDPSLYSTFQYVAGEVSARNPRVRIETVPGITGASAALSRLGLFVDDSLLITTSASLEAKMCVVLKATRPRELAEQLRQRGYREFFLAERVFMEGERTEHLDELPETSSYFTIVVARGGSSSDEQHHEV